MTALITVLLVDDHAVVREGYRRLLERDPRIQVVGEAGSSAQAYEQALALEPDVIVMDIALPGFSGIEAMRRILIDRVMVILERQIEFAEKKLEEKEDRQVDKEAVLLGNIARNLEKLIDLDKAQQPGREVKAENAEMQDMRRQLAGRIDALVKR